MGFLWSSQGLRGIIMESLSSLWGLGGLCGVPGALGSPPWSLSVPGIPPPNPLWDPSRFSAGFGVCSPFSPPWPLGSPNSPPWPPSLCCLWLPLHFPLGSGPIPLSLRPLPVPPLGFGVSISHWGPPPHSLFTFVPHTPRIFHIPPFPFGFFPSPKHPFPLFSPPPTI